MKPYRLFGIIAFLMLTIVFMFLILTICIARDDVSQRLRGTNLPWLWLVAAIILFVVLSILGPHLIWPGSPQEQSPPPATGKKT